MSTPPPDTGQTAVAATRAEAYGVFRRILDRVRDAGWDNQRVDTLIRDDQVDLRTLRWTIRYQYAFGQWLIHAEPDPSYTTPEVVRNLRLTVTIDPRRGHLPDPAEATAILLGHVAASIL